jgi:hypothetical protein
MRNALAPVFASLRRRRPPPTTQQQQFHQQRSGHGGQQTVTTLQPQQQLHTITLAAAGGGAVREAWSQQAVALNHHNHPHRVVPIPLASVGVAHPAVITQKTF